MNFRLKLDKRRDNHRVSEYVSLIMTPSWLFGCQIKKKKRKKNMEHSIKNLPMNSQINYPNQLNAIKRPRGVIKCLILENKIITISTLLFQFCHCIRATEFIFLCSILRRKQIRKSCGRIAFIITN